MELGLLIHAPDIVAVRDNHSPARRCLLDHISVPHPLAVRQGPVGDHQEAGQAPLPLRAPKRKLRSMVALSVGTITLGTVFAQARCLAIKNSDCDILQGPNIPA
jgi:hypothetical protein